MKRQRKACPALEAIESRQLLSTISLNGSFRGHFTEGQWANDSAEVGLLAVGASRPLGAAHLSGRTEIGGSLPLPMGLLELTSPHGTLDLRIIKHSGAGGSFFNAPTDVFDFYIDGGTGAYQGDRGSGEARITLHTRSVARSDQSGSVSIRFTSPPSGQIPPRAYPG